MMAYPVTFSILCLRPPQLRQAYPTLPYLSAYFTPLTQCRSMILKEVTVHRTLEEEVEDELVL